MFHLPSHRTASEMYQQAAQQGAAPDRLQLHSSFLLSPLPAAGELVVGLRRAAWSKAKVKNGVFAHCKVSRFQLCFRVANRARKYLCRKVYLFFSARAFSVFCSCVLFCKYLQAAFSHFRFRKVSRISFREYSQRVTISTARFCVLQVLVARHSRKSHPAQVNNRSPTRRCTRPPTAPFAAFRSQARYTSLIPLPAAGELVVVLLRVML